MFIIRILLFIFFSILALQAPALIDNYRVGCSAIVLELEQDYQKLEKIAQGFSLTVEQLFKEANETNNKKAKSIVNVMGEKIPRYIKLKKQLNILKKNELLSTIRVVFFEPDPILNKNMWGSFHFNIPMKLSSSWIFLIIVFSLSITILSNILFSFIILKFFRLFKKKSLKEV